MKMLFMWITLHGKASPYKIDKDFLMSTINSEPKYPRENILFQTELKESEVTFSLDALSKIYPCPATTLPDPKK